MRASSFIDLPQGIKAKKAVINVQNRDEACFAWAITSALRQPNGLPQRTSSYPHYDTVADFSDITFPMKLKEISKFEVKNNISVNVYGLESNFNGERMVNEVVGPLHFTKQRRMVHINLLLISTEDQSHYCWIKNLSRLVSSQKSRNGHEKYICEGCLIYFTTEEKLTRHQGEDCNQLKAVLPGNELKINKFGEIVPENILQFEKFEKQLKIPFIIYADFEALLKPVHTSIPDPTKPFTVKCFEHVPYSFAYYVKCSFDENLSKLELYRGENAGIEFMKRLENDIKLMYKYYLGKVREMIPLNDEEKKNYEEATTCHICDKPIENVLEKVCDHDHMSGAYRGAAHMTCNINYKEPKFVPIVFHNLSNYDSHLFIKTFALENEDVEVIAQNKEKYISFSKRLHVGDIIDCKGKKRKVFYKLRFIDSFRFMNCSLEKLASYLEDEQCKEIYKYYKEEKFQLIRQKGIFPYNFLTSFDKLSYQELPSKEEFYDIISENHVSEVDYARAKRVWDVFSCQNLGQYSDVYLTSDVLLLADVFENFRILCLENYKLDPAHYFTAPGLSWDAMLRMTGVKLELLTDIDMLHFF